MLFNIVLAILRVLLTRRNKAKRAEAAAALATETGVAASDEKIAHTFAFDDLTDKENPDFRYVF